MNQIAAGLCTTVGLLALLGLLPASSVGATEIGPEADLCAEIAALTPGAELILRPGDYQGPCTIRKGGVAGAPVVIRAQDPARPPRIVYEGARANVLSVRANHVVIRGLEFGPTQFGVDGVRIFGGINVVVEACTFNGLGGIAVVANHGDVHGLVVRGNVIRNSRSTGMYLGCHDGVSCKVSGLVVERNYVHGVRTVEPEIGYGIQVKLGSTGAIRDNVVVDTKGPGIMVYGSSLADATSIIERNFVVGSVRSSGIVVGGGPAVVRNNVVTGSAEAGIALEDYGRRGLLRGVGVAFNTLYGNMGGGITTPTENLREAIIVNNAVHARAGTAALPAAQPGALTIVGNVDCTWSPCFVNPEAGDFSPTFGSRLSGLAALRGDLWLPTDDYYGMRRGLPATVGAVERRGPPLAIGPKP